jgi:hypothetical protein
MPEPALRPRRPVRVRRGGHSSGARFQHAIEDVERGLGCRHLPARDPTAVAAMPQQRTRREKRNTVMATHSP